LLTLPYKRFQDARQFVFDHAQDIDRAWFRYVFEDADEKAFLHVLAEHQQPGGGFGGLYYEFDYQGVCLKSTEIAVRYLLSLSKRPSAVHPLVSELMKYLLGCYIPGRGNWGEVVVPPINEGIHCHWVRYRGEDVSPIKDENERIRRYDANEKAIFAAFIASYPELVPTQLYRDVLLCPTQHILRHWDVASSKYDQSIFESGQPYALEYFQWLVPCIRDEALSARLSAILCQNPTAFMELNFEKAAHDYVHLPCDSVCSPESVVYPVVKELVNDSLDYRIRQQAEDGRWPLGWSFGSNEGLQRLQKKYEAYRTLLMLVKLKNFGRIEDV